MPLIQVYGYERSIEQKRDMVKRLTAATSEVYKVPEEIVSVYFFDIPRTHAAHAGILASDRDPPPSEG